MTRTRHVQKLDRFFRRKVCAFLIAATLAAVIVLPALGQERARTSPQATSPGASASAVAAAQRPPQLPKELQERVAQDEKVIKEALTHIDNLEAIRAAIPKAEDVLNIRSAHQGETWWETIDARLQLADLRRFVTLPAEERATLAEAERPNDRIVELVEAGKYQQAIEPLLTMASAEQRILGDSHHWYANSLDELAQVYEAMDRYEQAEPLFRQALEIRKKVLGEEHPYYAFILNSLGDLYSKQAQYAQAEPLYKRALAIFEEALGPEHPVVATALNKLGDLYSKQGQSAKAEPLYKRARAIVPDQRYEHAALGELMIDGMLLIGPGTREIGDLLKIAEGILSFREQYQGGQWWQTIDARRRVADLQRLSGLDAEQRARFAEAIALGVQAKNLYNAGKYEEAVGLEREAGNAIRRTLGDEHPYYAASLNRLAWDYLSTGHYDQAESLFGQAMPIRRAKLGPQHPDYAMSLVGLATVSMWKGRRGQAETTFRQAHQILRGALTRVAILSASRQEDVFQYYSFSIEIAFVAGVKAVSEGRSAEADQQLRDSVAALEELVEKADKLRPLMSAFWQAESTNLTAEVGESGALRMRDFLEWINAVPYSSLARALDVLSKLYYLTDRNEEAEQVLKQELDIRSRVLREDSRGYASALNGLGVISWKTGHLEQAEQWYRQALDIVQKVQEEGPDYANLLANLSMVLASTKRDEEASRLLLASAQAAWLYFTRTFPALSAPQKREFLTDRYFKQSELLSSLVFQGKQVSAKVALRGALLSKQLLFEAARQESGALAAAIAAAPPEWRAKWQERERLRHQYATLALQSMSGAGEQQLGRAPVDPDTVRSLAKQIGELDEQLRQGNPTYSQQAQLSQMSLEDVTQALRPGEALLEYVRYQPVDFASGKRGSSHDGVFILLGASGQVAAIDLGDATTIDQAVQEFRKRMRKSIDKFAGVLPSQPQVRGSEGEIAEASSVLRALVWLPLEKQLSGVKRVYLAPDGQLSLIPFEALARNDSAGGWRYLAEDRELVYLGTGRDLARLALSEKSGEVRPKTAVLVSDPHFDAEQKHLAGIVAGLKPPRSSRGTNRRRVRKGDRRPWVMGSASSSSCQLPTFWPATALNDVLTAPADRRLEKLGWRVTTLSGDSAVEEAVLDVQAPRILQFATHGYYLNCSPESQGWDNPLLRSGMVMAGVNSWPKEHLVYYRVGREVLTEAQARARGLSEDQLQTDRVEVADGILTAYEVTGMNLQGTELVNLTACETGLGEVTPDGVAGLRQAFLLAGARSLTMSMWKVPAEETGKEVSDFYSRWLGGGSKQTRTRTRYEAFRAAQLAALKRARETYGAGHPFYWAGVVYVGDPGDLPAEATAPTGTAATEEK